MSSNPIFERLGRHAQERAKTGSEDMLSREHWYAYTSPSTISHETGVPLSEMLCSNAKEVTDNALDWADRHGCPGAVTVALEGSHTIIVRNCAGPGWSASPEELAQVFSLARGSISSKLWRLPTRGAMGRGLRQITGSVASGPGTITITSCDCRTVLRPRIEDGRTQVVETTQTEYPIGTEIRIEVDAAYPTDAYALCWAQTAIRLARNSQPPYLGRTSAHWFDADAFFGPLHAVAPGTKLRNFLGNFDGCSARNVHRKITARFSSKCLCSEFHRDSAAELLQIAQDNTTPVGAHRLGAMGPKAWLGYEGGYAVVKGCFESGAREPLATIPFVVECWADVDIDASEDDVTIGELTINRSPTISHYLCNRRRGRDVVLAINRCHIDLSLPKLEARFTVNITAPYVPVLSGGKLPDIAPFADAIGQAVEQAVTRARRCTRKPAPANATSKHDEKHETGRLHRILEDATCFELCNADELTVLSKDKDPYRLDTASGHRLGRWCARMIDRFLAPNARIHLRGLHYLLASAADVTRPDGERYINTDEMWRWLTETAIKAARWLGYVAFERIVDERNAPPELYLPSYYTVEAERGRGEEIIIPDLDEALPGFASPPWPVIQPYRIILIGEKTSLRAVLLPIAQEVGGELLLPTGEPSDTMIAELAARCAPDPRPSVVLYFSDFDPSGRQMPVSVSRKLQALHDLLYPELNIQLHPVALTLEQVRELALPSTPLKATEPRASRWREIMGHEQTEIDALAALHPQTLIAIARDAIQPYYDPTLSERTTQAEHDWRAECEELLETEAYTDVRTKIELSLELIEQQRQKLAELQDQAAALLADIQPPPIQLPSAANDTPGLEPLFDSRADFVTASRRLRRYKDLTSESEN